MTERYATVPVIKSSDLTAADRGIWFILCSFVQWEHIKGKPIRSKAGSCFPTVRKIAEEAGCSEDSARRSIRKLEALGYVVRKARHGEKGEQRSNDYTLFANPQAKSA